MSASSVRLTEVEVDKYCDCVLLVLPPAAGDELQAMKKGIMEVADIIVVNKADGPLANQASMHNGLNPRLCMDQHITEYTFFCVFPF